MAETDSDVASEQLTQDSEVEASPMGFPVDEIPQNNLEDDSAPQEEQPESTPTSNNNIPDEEIERGYLRQQDYTRKTQDHAEAVRQFEAQRSEFQREMEAQRAELAQMRQQFSQNQYQQQNVDPLLQAANNPNLTQEERIALQAMAQQNQALAELRQQFVELQEAQNQFGPQFQKTQQTLQALANERKAAEDAELRTQGQEASRIFGEQALRDNIDFIYRNFGTVNPQTGEKYTVAQLVGMATGKPVQARQEAVDRQRDERGRFKAEASTKGNNAPVNSGSYSRADAENEIDAILSSI